MFIICSVVFVAVIATVLYAVFNHRAATSQSVEAGAERRMTLAAAVAVSLALVFLGLKVLEYSDVEYRWDTHCYGSIVWTITGFYVAHVTAVILKTILVGIQSRLADFRQGRRLVVQSNGIYWHFVVAICPLYGVLYWAPRLL